MASSGENEFLAPAVHAPSGDRGSARRWVAAAVVVGLLVVGGAWGCRWYEVGRFQVSTDDAYVSADSVPVAPRIAGHVTEVDVDDNQEVKAGQLLARIDDRDSRAASAQEQAELDEAQAGLEAADAQVEQQGSQVAQARADLDGDRAGLGLAAREDGRARSLSSSGFGTGQALDRAESTLRQRLASLHHDEAALALALSKARTQEASRAYAAANLEKARADVARAALNIAYAEIRAPIDGMVGDRSIRLGAYVQAGTGLLTIVPTGRALYVTANLKETQLGRIRKGQAVTVAVDAFGGHAFRGRVQGVSPGTGAQFALLPPENATGNFTKIVQRVPVRVALDPADPLLGQLRAGMSVSVTIDTLGSPADGTPR